MISKMLWIQTLPSPERRCHGNVSINMRPKKSDLVLVNCGAVVFFSWRFMFHTRKLHFELFTAFFFPMLNFWIHKSWRCQINYWLNESCCWYGRIGRKGINHVTPFALGYKLFIRPRVVTLRETKSKFTPENHWLELSCLFSLAISDADARERTT